MTKTKLKEAIRAIQNQCKEFDELYIAIDNKNIHIYYGEDDPYKCSLENVDQIIDCLKFLEGFKSV